MCRMLDAMLYVQIRRGEERNPKVYLIMLKHVKDKFILLCIEKKNEDNCSLHAG